jgi:NAD(P) transhydrogenase subunit alpha
MKQILREIRVGAVVRVLLVLTVGAGATGGLPTSGWAQARTSSPARVDTTEPETKASTAKAESAATATTGHPHGSDFATLLFVLLLATLIGLGVISRVSRLLHTPLMSLTNAISAIAIVGAILVAGPDYGTGFTVVGAIAIAASMTNIVSGFLITDRMLKMFKQREPKQP